METRKKKKIQWTSYKYVGGALPPYRGCQLLPCSQSPRALPMPAGAHAPSGPGSTASTSACPAADRRSCRSPIFSDTGFWKWSQSRQAVPGQFTSSAPLEPTQTLYSLGCPLVPPTTQPHTGLGTTCHPPVPWETPAVPLPTPPAHLHRRSSSAILLQYWGRERREKQALGTPTRAPPVLVHSGSQAHLGLPATIPALRGLPVWHRSDRVRAGAHPCQGSPLEFLGKF